MSSEVGPHHFRKDHELEGDIRAELEWDHDIPDPRLVEVRVNDGVVQLTGFAGSFAEKCAIERAVARVVGVKDVRDYLDVPPVDHHLDRRLESAARCALAWDARVPGGVRAEVTDGVVRLGGSVDHYSQREAAADAIHNLIGVRDVVNEIKVTTVSSPVDLASHVAAAIRRRFGHEAVGIRIATRDGAITLGGAVPRYGMLDDVERTVRAVPGVTRVDNQLLVA